jgi:predicted SAM-dependent methyltransferase
LSNADKIITLTQNAKDEILTWGVNRVKEDKITVIPCCADLEHFSYNKIDENKIMPLIKEIYRIMKPRGTIILQERVINRTYEYWRNIFLETGFLEQKIKKQEEEKDELKTLYSFRNNDRRRC